MSVSFNKKECEKALRNMRACTDEIQKSKQKIDNYELIGAPAIEAGEVFTSLNDTYSKLSKLIIKVTENLELITSDFEEQEKKLNDAIKNGVGVK